MVCLDTSSLIRFFTNDEPAKAQKVKLLLKKEKKVFIPEVVFPELEYVLSGKYKLTRDEIAKLFKFLLSRSNIKSKKYPKLALNIFESTKLDMADCLIAAHSLKCKLASFDKKLLLVSKVVNYW